MPRPETPEPIAGSEWLDGRQPVRVVGAGPRWIWVIAADHYDAYLQDPQVNRWSVRKFLRKDMSEGEPGKRVGRTVTLRTVDQVAYDDRVDEAHRYVRDVAGLNRRWSVEDGPFGDGDNMIELARMLRDLLVKWYPDDVRYAQLYLPE